MKNGYEYHMSTRMMIPKGIERVAQPGDRIIIRQNELKTWLIVPCSRKKNCHTSEVRIATEEAAQGINKHHPPEAFHRQSRAADDQGQQQSQGESEGHAQDDESDRFQHHGDKVAGRHQVLPGGRAYADQEQKASTMPDQPDQARNRSCAPSVFPGVYQPGTPAIKGTIQAS